MTTRYRVEYALKTHRRDQLIEWIKGLLAVPFVLHSQPTAAYSSHDALSPSLPRSPSESVLSTMATTTHRRYAEILRDVEKLISDHMAHQRNQTPGLSKLKHLVPTVGTFFTPLPLERAFTYQDRRRRISSRRFVAPSFNDVRCILNTAQLMALAEVPPNSLVLREAAPPIPTSSLFGGRKGLALVTFDGDLTLYPDGQSLEPSNPIIPRILKLLSQGIHIGIVTAAGYTEASRYEARLHGLLKALNHAVEYSPLGEGAPASMVDLENVAVRETRLVIMGGESNYLFCYDPRSKADDRSYGRLKYLPRKHWALKEMKGWTEADITALLDVAEAALRDCIQNMALSATVIRKNRAVGIIPTPSADGVETKFTREQLEETVLVTQQVVEMSPAGKKIPFCAFNGGNDVFVDIGDKSLGVRAVQAFLGGTGSPIGESETLHVGDQFLSAGANDFKARLACTTAWIANPGETVQLLDELQEHVSKQQDVKLFAT